MKNVDTVKGIYAAFGRGDIPAILEHVADECDWEYAYSNMNLPWIERRRGREGAGAAFAAFVANLDFEHFAVKTIVGANEGALVIAICDVSMKIKSTGKKVVEQDEPHLWHFDPRGRIVRFRHCADTLQQYRAAQP